MSRTRDQLHGRPLPRMLLGFATLLLATLLLTIVLLPATAQASDDFASPDADRGVQWEGYLDYAYVYSSADPAALRQRLDEYGRAAGVSLPEYLFLAFESRREQGIGLDQASVRREAIGNFLLYLVDREPDLLERAVDGIETFRDQRGRHENAYWLHYIMAHRALEKGKADAFARHNLDLWLEVVVPLESAYETLEALSLAQSPNSGFVSALPYVFENLARLILIRSQEMGMNRGLDSLGAIVRLLADGRVGAHPDVIPAEASSREYLNRIIDRVNGYESDGGSLTFTLALFEAGRYHEHARGLLAAQGLSEETTKAISVASGAYEAALDRAETLQGRVAVYIRVLRQLGEVYAAKQRLGVDPYVETPFQIEGAIDVYSALFEMRQDDQWKQAGFRSNGREAYVRALHSLWEELQETHLNAADYYLSRSMRERADADDLARSAARMYSRYLSFFEQFATPDSREFVPDSAYFAAYECARGFGDVYLSYGGISNPRPAEIDLVVERYTLGLRTYPFDRSSWARLATALERKGQSNEYLAVARPIADEVVRSRHVYKWAQTGDTGAEGIRAMRRALSDDLVLMFLGFASLEADGELEQSLASLELTRDGVRAELSALRVRRDPTGGGSARGDAFSAPAAPARNRPNTKKPTLAERSEITRGIHAATLRLAKLERQIKARSRALPLFRAAAESDALIDALRGQRDHPVHRLLRRMYHEKNAARAEGDEFSRRDAGGARS